MKFVVITAPLDQLDGHFCGGGNIRVLGGGIVALHLCCRLELFSDVDPDCFYAEFGSRSTKFDQCESGLDAEQKNHQIDFKPLESR